MGRPFAVCLSIVWFLLLGLGTGKMASAASLESVLSPGDLTTAHIRQEDNCKNCHVPFEKGAQDTLCLACHKDIGKDRRAKSGFHGKSAIQACKGCHTEHKGRGAKIVNLEVRQFNHAKTDFLLKGSHATAKCDACHRPGVKFRNAPQDCVGCHRGDDKHKGSLGTKCADCHTEKNWKEALFDHGKTRFALTGKHVGVTCASCHEGGRFKNTPMTCNGCHANDDKHKGRLGDACEKCHTVSGWKESTFNHDRDTDFDLRGAHRPLKCDSCHASNPFRQKTPMTCIACHKSDDKHQGTLGNACANCHVERSWKEARFDHSKTRFPLLGKHDVLDCKDCHRSKVFTGLSMDCVSCHKKDDIHKGALGDKCDACHQSQRWKSTRFDHATTRFALNGAHAKASCNGCHLLPDGKLRYRDTPMVCVACHQKDDAHKGSLGNQCSQCHSSEKWKVALFDHGRTRFPLTGKHQKTTCNACHASQQFNAVAKTCQGCHQKDDVHNSSLGKQCEECHGTRDWSLWNFEHKKKTGFALTGKHEALPCKSCHIKPATSEGRVPPLGRNCIACHVSDDAHEGAFGTRCEQCHTSSNWKELTNQFGGQQ